MACDLIRQCTPQQQNVPGSLDEVLHSALDDVMSVVPLPFVLTYTSKSPMGHQFAVCSSFSSHCSSHSCHTILHSILNFCPPQHDSLEAQSLQDPHPSRSCSGRRCHFQAAGRASEAQVLTVGAPLAVTSLSGAYRLDTEVAGQGQAPVSLAQLVFLEHASSSQ